MSIREAQIWHIDATIEVKKLYVNYWINMVKTGAYKGRKVFTGDKQFSDQELIEDCMNTALNHIQGINELIEERLGLMKGI